MRVIPLSVLLSLQTEEIVRWSAGPHIISMDGSVRFSGLGKIISTLLKPANSCVGVCMCVCALAGATHTEVESLPMYIIVWASPCSSPWEISHQAQKRSHSFFSICKYMPRWVWCNLKCSFVYSNHFIMA